MISVAEASFGLTEVAVTAPGSSRSILSLQTQQLQRSCTVAASWSLAGAWLQKQQLQRLGALHERAVSPEAAVQLQRPGALQERAAAPEAAVAASWPFEVQPLGASQERCRGHDAAVAAFGSAAGALQGPRSSSCSIGERCRNVPEARKQ